jgi:hypothetical protein
MRIERPSCPVNEGTFCGVKISLPDTEPRFHPIFEHEVENYLLLTRKNSLPRNLH